MAVVAPNPELTERALRLGLATVCDEPFALDAAAAARTVALAQGVRVPLSPYQDRPPEATVSPSETPVSPTG
ncbi:hypothetical protein [Kineococcus arenarius]|uniref:hypothetical protein n=1 Tax=Kineococcus sp. SYSU DK021 TaxID=3383142 RepID=UPI003D7CFBAD